MEKTYRVLGMTCDGCANAVRNAIIAQVPGAEVAVDLDKKEVRVTAGTDDDGAIQKSVTGAGFEYAGLA